MISSLLKVVAVGIKCPNCDFEVKKSLLSEGLREVQLCRNIECEVEEFDVDEDRITRFYLKHEV